MATRRDVRLRKLNMHRELVQGWREGTFAAGDPAPSVRELAGQYQLSSTVVTQTLQELLRAGVLYTVPSVGTYFGEPPTPERGIFLIAFPYPAIHNMHFSEVQIGFEEFLSRKGGHCLALSYEAFDQFRDHPEFRNLGGVFDVRLSRPLATSPTAGWIGGEIPLVRFLPYFEDSHACDTIAFDDFDGGCQATRHLLQMGHQRIGFLGLHRRGDETGFRYSIERERGWKATMTRAGLPAEGLSFGPDREVDVAPDIQVEAIREVARGLVDNTGMTALVTCGVMATIGLVRAFEEARVPGDAWPAIVSFDDTHEGADHVVSAMRLPWRELGQQAAQLLWDRSTGTVPAPPRHLDIPMRLVRRLTSRPAWGNALQAGQLTKMTAAPYVPVPA